MTALTRRVVLGTALLAAAPAFAQQQATRPAAPADPVAALRAFYARPQNAAVERYMSATLRRLYLAQKQRARRTSDVLPGLDFQFECGCQDNDDNYAGRNVYTAGGRTEREATVVVRLKLFESQPETRELTFKLVLENGRWLIDDVLAMGANPWVFSSLLQMRD